MQGNQSIRNAALLPCSLFASRLPTEAQTLLLRFCLLDGQAALDGWHAWHRCHGAAAEALLRIGPRSVRGLNVLLLDALRRHAIICPDRVVQVLRLNTLKERLRSDAYRRTLGDTLAPLREVGIEALVLPGAALAETLYRRPEQRHCHGIDLMIRAAQLDRAAAVLASNGYRRTGADSPAGLSLVHDNALPLTLRTVPLPLAGAEALIEPYWNGARPAKIAGQAARVAAVEDNLLQVLVTAQLSPRRWSLRWVTDAWFLIQHGAELSWQVFAERAHAAQVSMLAYAGLSYLADRLGAGVPDHALARLADASHHEPLGRDNALHTLWVSTARDLRAVHWLVGGRHLRRPAFQWLLMPSWEYVRRAGGGAGRWGRATLCARRAARLAGRTLRRRGARRGKRGRATAVPRATGTASRHGR